MPFKRTPETFTASINAVTIGTGDTAITLGGENVMPLYSFDAPIANRPAVGAEVSDLGINENLPALAAFFEGDATPLQRAVRLAKTPGVDFIDIHLEGANPDGEDRSVEECVELCTQIAEAVDADKFIYSLPRRFDSEVKERGATLSAGQRQLLAFARALAFDPKILVLDEATANIDTETEQIIQKAMHKISKDRTTIVVAHRLSTIQNADKIIVLHKGRIREMGNHQELLNQEGHYYHLYQLQYKDQELTAIS